MVQILSTPSSLSPLNPTHGSGWMVQILSTPSSLIATESHPRQWVDCSDPFYTTIPIATESHPRQWVDCSDLNDPPTTVGGIPDKQGNCGDRKDLNKPLTSVSGFVEGLSENPGLSYRSM